MSHDAFWSDVHQALDELESATTVATVIDTLNRYFTVSCGDASFPGSGGDRQLFDALRVAGWKIAWAEADYFYLARDPSGGLLTYIEGDVYAGDHR